MAGARKLLKLLRNSNVDLNKHCLRKLYTAESLGLAKYQEQRERTVLQYSGGLMEEKFKSKVREAVTSEAKNPVFVDDFKSFIHMAIGTPEDAETVVKLCKRYEEQRKLMRFSTFTFGPIVMRYFHLFGKPAEALQVFTDPTCNEIFQQFTTFKVLMDLLFEQGMYNESLSVFDTLRELKISGYSYHKSCTTLALASCYKLNTPQSYEKAVQLTEEVVHAGGVLTRRALIFVSALAIKQKDPMKALELLSSDSAPYVSIINLKILALSHLDRPEDAFPIIRRVLGNEEFPRKTELLSEVLKELNASIDRVADAGLQTELKSEFSRIEKVLMEAKKIQGTTIEDLLFFPINDVPKETNQKSWDVAMRGASFDRNSRDKRRYDEDQD